MYNEEIVSTKLIKLNTARFSSKKKSDTIRAISTVSKITVHGGINFLEEFMERENILSLQDATAEDLKEFYTELLDRNLYIIDEKTFTEIPLNENLEKYDLPDRNNL